jgi:hypothetical protein
MFPNNNYINGHGRIFPEHTLRKKHKGFSGIWCIVSFTIETVGSDIMFAETEK